VTSESTVAALDCGTNSTRLLIADREGEERQRLMRITRLGQGVDATHVLAPEAIERTLAVLREFRSVMDSEGVAGARLVATSAVRDAANGVEFLRRATETIGVEAELLPGDEEGRLAYRGATRGMTLGSADTVVVDIGGGSTELIVDEGDGVRAVSLELGCVRLSERFLRHDPPEAQELAAAVEEIQRQLSRAVQVIPALDRRGEDRLLIGLAGSVSTLSALSQGLTHYDRSRLHHSVLSQSDVEAWCTSLAAEPASARAVRPGMIEGRQDVIVGGALVLREVMTRFAFSDCMVSESDILDGLVMSLLGRPQA
jgi:exopolyphosphatase/guanosine-5'-triphosphate,3'-diphosphate pyrophosphatase